MRPQPHPLTYILPVLGMALAWVLLTGHPGLAPLFFRNSLAFWYPFVVAASICGFTWAVVKEPQRKILHSVIAIIFTLINILMVWPVYQNSLFGHPHSKRPAGEIYRPLPPEPLPQGEKQ